MSLIMYVIVKWMVFHSVNVNMYENALMLPNMYVALDAKRQQELMKQQRDVAANLCHVI